MARTSKRTTLGNYITKVNNFDIRLLFNMVRNSTTGKSSASSHDYKVCRGGKLIKAGFKTKEAAIEFAKSA